MNRLHRSYIVGNLHPGTGDLLEGALYLAQVTHLYAGEPWEVLEKERNLAMQEVRHKIGSEVCDSAELFLRAVQQVHPDMLEAATYLSSHVNTPYLRVINMLVERKMARERSAKISLGPQTVEEAIEVVRKLYDSDDELAYFQRPSDFAGRIAVELQTYRSRGGQ